MNTVNMLQAKSTLSRLVQAVENGEEREIIISRNGKPAAKLVPVSNEAAVERRIGVAKGLFEVPDDIDLHNDEVQRLFLADDNQ